MMTDFFHLLNALQGLLQHRRSQLPQLQDIRIEVPYEQDITVLKAEKESAALEQGLEISEPAGLLIESDGGPERFAEIALMKPKSVDTQNRSNIAIRD